MNVSFCILNSTWYIVNIQQTFVEWINKRLFPLLLADHILCPRFLLGKWCFLVDIRSSSFLILFPSQFSHWIYYPPICHLPVYKLCPWYVLHWTETLNSGLTKFNNILSYGLCLVILLKKFFPILMSQKKSLTLSSNNFLTLSFTFRSLSYQLECVNPLLFFSWGEPVFPSLYAK